MLQCGTSANKSQAGSHWYKPEGFECYESNHDYLCWGETLANGLSSLIGMK
ncbi:MAG: hypothetical protein ACREV6_01390 [Clostridium sp.]|uniref:hypothetical protein n=1 Tax=Clostridium sp. TaxID=1506 RepID=UPI003D6D694B